MSRKLKSGLFITFEGGEGAGKTTLIQKVVHYFASSDYPLLKTREPGGTKLGEEIRSILLKNSSEPIAPFAELCLFLSSRAQHVFELIQPALDAHKIVLCDRFNDSSVAYQGAARGLGMKRVSELCNLAIGLEPQLTIYLDIDPEAGLARVKKSREQDRIEAEALDFHRKIREAYLKICLEHKSRFHLIDASQSPDAVFEEAIQRINILLKSRIG